MIAILKQSASDEAVGHIVSWIEKKGLKTDVSRGENETIIGLVGDTTKIDPFLLESMDVVERVQRVSEPFKRANRKFHPDDTIVDVGGHKIGGGYFAVMSGPCSVESKEQITYVAQRVQAAGASILRGGAFKPRTSPYTFQGLGEQGAALLALQAGVPVIPVYSAGNYQPFQRLQLRFGKQRLRLWLWPSGSVQSAGQTRRRRCDLFAPSGGSIHRPQAL